MLFFQILMRSARAVCFSLSPFTQHGSTGTAQVWLLGKMRVTASLACSSAPGEGEGAAVLTLFASPNQLERLLAGDVSWTVP